MTTATVPTWFYHFDPLNLANELIDAGNAAIDRGDFDRSVIVFDAAEELLAVCDAPEIDWQRAYDAYLTTESH